jgi:hypothetical protein
MAHGHIVSAYFPKDAPSAFKTTDENVPEAFRLFYVEPNKTSGMLLRTK